MSQRMIIYIGMFIGSSIGSVLPVIWGGSMLSLSSVMLSAVGGIVGVIISFEVIRRTS